MPTARKINTRENVVANYRATLTRPVDIAEFDGCDAENQFVIACEELNFDPDAPQLARQILTSAIEFDAIGIRARLITQANQSADYAELSRDAKAAKAADGMKLDCLRAYDWIGRDDLPAGERAACVFSDRCGVFVVALGAACKSLGIDPQTAREAAGEWKGN